MCNLTAKETTTERFVDDCSITCSQDVGCFYFGFNESLERCIIFEECPGLQNVSFVMYEKSGLYIS